MKKDLFDIMKKYMVMGVMVITMFFILTGCDNNEYDNGENRTSTESPSSTGNSDGDEVNSEKNTENTTSQDGTIEYEKSYEIEGDGNGNFNFEMEFYGNEILDED